MPRLKRRIVAAMLLAFAIWPLLHYSLVQRYGLEPWKFAGWAMYTVPRFLPRVEVFELRDGRRVKIPLIGSRFEAAADELVRFRAGALSWGELAVPDEVERLARQALDTREPIEIVITRFYVDPKPARLSVSRSSYFYQAD